MVDENTQTPEAAAPDLPAETAAPESPAPEQDTTQTTSPEQTPVQETQEAAPPTQDTPPPETPPAPEAETPAERVVPAADGYKLPEGAPPDLGQFAHDNNMTQQQLDNTLMEMGKYINARDHGQKVALRQAAEAHVKNWGESRQYNLSLIKRALGHMDPEGKLTTVLNETGYVNHPVVLDFLLFQGKNLKEGGFLRGSVNRPPGKRTAAQSMYGDNHPSKE